MQVLTSGGNLLSVFVSMTYTIVRRVATLNDDDIAPGTTTDAMTTVHRLIRKTKLPSFRDSLIYQMLTYFQNSFSGTFKV